MKKIIMPGLILLVLLFTATDVFTQGKGDKAPNIKIYKWLNGQPEIAGKPIFLEFWATWCGPCRRAIPHINELQKKYGNDVIFISVTAEDPEKVAEFMKNNDMKAYIGIDDNGTTNSNYGVRFIPHAFLINEKGRIEWVGSPTLINEELLAKFITSCKDGSSTGDNSSNTNDLINKKAPTSQDPNSVKYNLFVKKSTMNNEAGSFTDSKDGLEFHSMPLSTIFEILLNASPQRVQLSGDLQNDKYDFTYKHESNIPFAEYRTILLERLTDALNLNIQTEQSPAKVYKIKCKNCANLEKEFKQLSAKSNSFESKFEEKNGKISAQCVNIATLIRYLESMHKKIFIDETGLIGFYNFSISQANINAAINDLEKAGLQISQEEANIDFYKLVPR